MDVSPATGANVLQQANDILKVQTAVYKKNLDIQQAAFSELINSVPPPQPLATSGNLGTQLNVYA